MPRFDIFFFAGGGFLAGAAAGGLDLSFLGTLILAAAAAAGGVIIYRYRPNWLSSIGLSGRLSLIMMVGFLLGSLHYSFHDYLYHQRQQIITEIDELTGRVIEPARRRPNSQIVKLQPTDSRLRQIRLLAYLPPYPALAYGDIIEISGRLEQPPLNYYGRYLAKENIHATVAFPDWQVLGRDRWQFWSILYGVRGYIQTTANRLLNQSQAAFLRGVLLGDRDEFSEEFLNKLSLSGTRHLTALSGLHLTIIIFAAGAFFLTLFGKWQKAALTSTISTIFLFVAMTGFRLSAMRAAVMASLASLGRLAGRKPSPRNAIVLAALIIVLANPKTIIFDLGFQLSFAATWSIIYLTPVLRRLSFFRQPGRLGWREVLMITLTAQIGVAPLAISTFANFSLTALPANVAILVIMPVLLVLGLLAVGAAAISFSLAEFAARPISFLIDYAQLVIDFFASRPLLFNPRLGIIGGFVYWLVLFWISQSSRRQEDEMKAKT